MVVEPETDTVAGVYETQSEAEQYFVDYYKEQHSSQGETIITDYEKIKSCGWPAEIITHVIE